ncbi:hypothetical protein FS837_007121 [Tulasnella sp. UAMH 9824]|nr:hypothetical protein FS837_007121 [Tulasnella sp. UAMH 9824]
MRNVLATTLTTLGLLVSSWSSPLPPVPSGTVVCFLARIGPPIVASTPGTPVTGLQLAVDVTPATLETTGFTGGWDFVNGGIGAFYGCHDFWLNIGTSTKSYKPLSWAFDNQVTTNWIAAEGSKVTAAATASYNATSSFLACKEATKWRLYLQTGTDKPAGFNCTTTELFVKKSS